MKATYKGEQVRGFDVIVNKGDGVTINYTFRGHPHMHGRRAIEVMEELNRRGFDAVALTETNGVEEHLRIDEMKATVLMPDGWQAKGHDEAMQRLETQMEMAI